MSLSENIDIVRIDISAAIFRESCTTILHGEFPFSKER
jgi:hypothetical protein